MSAVVKTKTTKNNIIVIKTKFFDSSNNLTGSAIESSCNCFGLQFRTHSNSACKNIYLK